MGVTGACHRNTFSPLPSSHVECDAWNIRGPFTTLAPPSYDNTITKIVQAHATVQQQDTPTVPPYTIDLECDFCSYDLHNIISPLISSNHFYYQGNGCQHELKPWWLMVCLWKKSSPINILGSSNHVSNICSRAKKHLGMLYRRLYRDADSSTLRMLYTTPAGICCPNLGPSSVSYRVRAKIHYQSVHEGLPGC